MSLLCWFLFCFKQPVAQSRLPSDFLATVVWNSFSGQFITKHKATIGNFQLLSIKLLESCCVYDSLHKEVRSCAVCSVDRSRTVMRCVFCMITQSV